MVLEDPGIMPLLPLVPLAPLLPRELPGVPELSGLLELPEGVEDG